MRIEHLEERILDYKNSLKKIVEKRILWKSNTKDFIISVLKKAENNYAIGWQVQELNWIHSNEAVNITFDSFPPDMLELTNQLPTFQFLQGGSLVFSQLHNGDINVLILYPVSENSMPLESDTDDLGVFMPTEITEGFIVEKLDVFLKKIIKRDIPLLNKTVGFSKENS
ncbi:hypothetical protein [Planktosalinus lacus]|uniref:Uncharacterized protein n=1 Tax=Planktosalinus lacus TaxID=1526573 RepID=A0A8J2VA16_9FLAO|nr:hypothetical protein [Planktosalinus lacus]GGD92042.1 hypothetical protein GCM10011312_14830 [Planktosalinus lacus]